MVTQLHLALILAIDAKVLVLDEPTLGLDLLYRRQFYDTLLNDYFDKERTILLTTHQVEEVENLFTDVIFISRGEVVLASSVEDLGARYLQLTVSAEHAAPARALKPFYEREIFGRVALFFEGHSAAELSALGELRAAPVSAAAGSDTRGILLTLMRREFWEHTALWRVPLIVAGLLAISTIFSVGAVAL